MNFIKLLKYSIFFLALIYAKQSLAQGILKPKFGLRAGASFSTMFGPDEAGVDEERKLTVRVAAGVSVKVPFHERFGMNAEVAFVQKGAYCTASAENSFLKLPQFLTEQPIIYGYNKSGNTYTKRTDKNYKKRNGLNITNGYIEVPVMFYVEPVDDKLQIDLGASIGFLISSQALGTLKFGEADILDASNPDASQFIEMNLDYKYIQNEIGEHSGSTSAKIDGTTRYYPSQPAAYYLTDETAKNDLNYFNLLDIGLQAGISYYFTPGLRIGTRFNYSLIDITTNKYDYSFKDLNSDGTYIIRDDHDVNFGFQIFVGLQF